jgi:uncharacterized protein YjbI with pentapeptide repeats
MGNPYAEARIAMAVQEHVNLVAEGSEAVERWKAENPNSVLDCSNFDFNADPYFAPQGLDHMDFSFVNFAGANLAGKQLTGIDFSGANLEGTNFENANLSNANLSAANLRRAKFSCATLQEADLTRANIDDTNFSHANLTVAKLSGVTLRNAVLVRAQFHNVSLEDIDLSGCDLSGAVFDNANLTNANFSGANLQSARFQSAKLIRVNLRSADLRYARLVGADLIGSDLSEAEMFEAAVDRANFDGVEGLPLSKYLTTVRFEKPGTDVRYFDLAVVSRVDDILSWERIRFLGRLHLFAASYAALVVIPFMYYVLDVFNRNVDVVRAWAQAESERGGAINYVAETVLIHLHREPIPALSLTLLISTILLGAGATIFATVCPARIREFNREQWRDQLGHSLIHYLPYAWRHRWLRILCLLLYVVGGAGVALVLISKLWNVGVFIWRNSL